MTTNLLTFFSVLSLSTLSFGSATASARSGATTCPSTAELKTQIISIARANMTRTDNFPEVRALLDARIQCLTDLNDEVTETTLAQYAAGSWQQIWSDELNLDPPGLPRDFTQIYQYIDAGGWGYNFGIRTPSTGEVLFVLRAKASAVGNQVTTEITDAFSREKGFYPGEDIGTLARSIEAGTATDILPRSTPRFPKGPIGAKGVLSIEFLDQDLKLGYSPNVFTGKIELFVMQRL